jgi:hypothetical protein
MEGKVMAEEDDLEIECSDCGLVTTFSEMYFDLMLEDLNVTLHRIGWKRLDPDAQSFRCLDCRINLIEGCSSVKDEVG